MALFTAANLGWERTWSLDHLFLDQEGVPTLVEVKRSSDTRIRREVVGQMLDYAANAVIYWPPEMLRARFEARCDALHEDAKEAIAKFLGDESGGGDSVEHFWEQVKTNLQAGKIRMIFVADRVPSELRRIIEFLNGQMTPAEVFAVEVQQFLGDNLQTLVPRVVGKTAVAEQKKGAAPRPEKRSIQELMQLAQEKKIAPLVEVCRQRKGLWEEHPSNAHEGSLKYRAKLPNANRDRLVFGVNIAGGYASPSPGEVDAWIPTASLAEVTGQGEAAIRKVLNEKFTICRSNQVDCVLRLKTTGEAETLVSQLKKWVAEKSGKAAESKA